MGRVSLLVGGAALGLAVLAGDGAWAQRGELRVVEAGRPAFRPPRGVGQLMVTDATGSPHPLPVVRYHAHVLLHPPVALVQIDQSFYNPLPARAEGTFVFSLPRGASVSRFAMFVTHDALMEGELIDRQRAGQIYESIVYQRLDPGILEQTGENVFKMRVFPIPSADTKRVLLDYTFPLESDDGQYRFVLPLPGEGEPIWDFRVTGAIRGATVPGSVVCQSHPQMEIECKADQPIRFNWKEENYRPAGDLVLRFSEPVGPGPRLWAYTAAALYAPQVTGTRQPQEQSTARAATYFHLSIPPEPPAGPPPPPAPADVVLLAETSALTPNPQAVRQAVAKVLGSLRPEDRFRLASVDVVQRWLTPDWTPASGDQCQRVLRRFDEGVFLGALDLKAGLREAAKAFSTTPPGRRRLVIYVGSAALAEDRQWFTRPPREEIVLSLEPAILDLSRAGCSFLAVIPARKNAGEERLRHVARKVGGLVFSTEFQRGQEEFQAWLNSGLPSPEPILELSIEGASQDDVFAPTGWVPGRALTLVGRCEPTASIQLKLVVMRQGQPVVRQWKLAVESKPDDVFVGRLWAQRKIEQLLRLDQSTPGFLAQEPRQEVVALSQEWSLLTPYTAFLVLENEADYARWGVPRQLRRRYWSPPEALEPLPLAGMRRWADGAMKPAPLPPFVERLQQAAVAQAIDAARQALSVGDARRAQFHLDRVAYLPSAQRSPQYQEMVRKVAQVNWRQAVLQALGSHRAFFAAPAAELAPFVPDLGSLAQPHAPPEFLRTHPHAYRLLQSVQVEPRTTSVAQLAELLAKRTGANVVVDRKALDDSGLAVDRPFEVRAWGKMSLREYVRRALSQQRLVLIEEPHRLLVTTEDAQDASQRLEVHPVGDLLHPGCTADVAELGAPYLDAELAAQTRLREKLQRPVTLDYREAPLGAVLSDLARMFGDNVFVDLKAMEDAGITQQDRVSAQWRDVPLGESLRWLLGPLSLEPVLHGQTLVITTREEAADRRLLTTRVYSCRGVVYALKPELAASGAQWGWGSGGDMGGGFGLGGFGGFGFSGDVRSLMGPGGGGFFGAPFEGAGLRQERRAPSASRDTRMLSSGGEAVELPAAAKTAAAPAGATEQAAQEKLEERPAAAPPAAEGPAAAPRLPPGDVPSMADLSRWPAGFMGQPLGPGGLIDQNSLIDAIVCCVAPTAWDEVGGPGGLGFFYPTLDLVVRTSDDVHRQIEDLLDQLRKLRPAPATLRDYIPAEKLIDSAQWPSTPDFDTLIEIITRCVSPEKWDEVGGPCSIREDPMHEALVISAMPDIHDEVRHLLTLLRRSRYEALRGSRPWETGHGQSPWVRPREGAALSAAVALARLPEPEPRELQLLSVRREPANLRTQWRRIDAQGNEQRMGWRATGPRLQMELPGWTIRTEDEQAAVAYPTLQLVELGPWGESARRMLDAWLPWLPHRTNAELARLFQVSPAPAQPPDAAEGLVRLRFALPGYADPARAWIDMTFSRRTGQVVGWESWFDGRLAQRLRFSYAEGPSAGLREVRMEDASGARLARWELLASEAQQGPIPALEAGWAGYVRLDHRTQTAQVDRDFCRGVQCLRNGDWENAAGHLRAALEAQRRHPLVLLLLAYAVQQGKLPVPHEQVLAWLREVVESPAADLARFLAQGHLPGLSAVETYELLARQPAQQRTPADWQRLAQAALEAGKHEQALAHAQSAMAAYRPKPHPWALEKVRLLALLALGRNEEARGLVAAWTDQWPGSPIERVEVAGRLAAHGLKEQAVRVCDQALATPGLTPAVRAELLGRRAEAQVGMARWRTLLEAATLLMPMLEKERGKAAREPLLRSPRPSPFYTLLFELNSAHDAAAAAALAAEAKSPLLRMHLLICQAELTPDPQVAADALQRAATLAPLPDEYVVWACRQWNAVGRPAEVIRELEGRLRAGKRLWEGGYELLEQAYRAVGRELDAMRAASSRSLEALPGL